jgi:hypothetical protein
VAGDFRIRVDSGVVFVVESGTLDFSTSYRALASAVEAAKAAATTCLLIDVRDADLTNYYSYIVRHAEAAGEFGLDSRFRIAVLGQAGAADVLSFIETVARNRGLKVRSFLEVEPALDWLRADRPEA